MLLELGSGRLDERSVMDAGRTHSLAGAAVETLIHLLVELRIQQIQAFVRDRPHHPEAAPW